MNLGGDKRLGLFAAALCALSSFGCVDYLNEGELGRIRYFGEVRGAAPLRMIPPVADRDGNVYALYGAPGLNEVEAFVGHGRGGWTSGCFEHKGDDRGAHGWVGVETGKAWYWSGDALVEVDGDSGECEQILDADFRTGAGLNFEGVVPMVIEKPSRSIALALVSTSADAVPYHIVVDLSIARYTDARPFEPAGATNVVVLGVGADRDSRTGFMVVKYQLGDENVVEGLFLDDDGNEIGRAPIADAGASAEDAVLGYLQSVDGNMVAGVLETGEIVSFDRSGGAARVFNGFGVAGVHKWDGSLYLVGMGAADPMIARIDSAGTIGAPAVWQASLEAAGSLQGDLAVLDERTEPRQTVGWADPVSAIGPMPFISAHSPDVYATDTTGWLLAGPGFQLDSNPQTSVAFAPVGISYR
jgi:hypothetical protein